MDERSLQEWKVLPTDLLANMSHELRSPLSLIKGAAETLLLLDRRTSRQQRRDFLLVIKEASDELADRIDQLLELAQLDSGNLDLVHAPVNLAHLVGKALRSAQERLAARTQQPGVPQAHLRFSWHLEDAQEREPAQAEPLNLRSPASAADCQAASGAMKSWNRKQWRARRSLSVSRSSTETDCPGLRILRGTRRFLARGEDRWGLPWWPIPAGKLC